MSLVHTIERAKRGDLDAQRELVQAFYPSVLRFLVTLCPNPADAEELTQETFVKAFRSLRSFRGDSGLRTWLHRIAFHEFAHRRRQERPIMRLPIHATGPLFEARSVLALDLESALQDLSLEFRAAFVLCDVQELSMAEAATVLAVPEGTIKSRLHTARRRLAEILEPEREEANHA